MENKESQEELLKELFTEENIAKLKELDNDGDVIKAANEMFDAAIEPKETDAKEVADFKVSMKKQVQLAREGKKIQRNDKCPCESGKKYKSCCIDKEEYNQLKEVA